MSASTVDTSLAADLRVAVGRLQRRLRQEGAKGELTASQLSALFTVERLAPVRLVDLAAAEAVAAPTLTRTVASLEEAGLVARAADSDDRRAARLTLTATGRARLRRIRSERTAWLQRRLDALTAQDQRRLAELVPLLTALVDGEGAR